MAGKRNIWSGFLFLGLFMLYAFALVYLRDFAPGKEAWIASYGSGTDFESRLVHAHGNLFAEVAIGAPPLFVLVGGALMMLAMFWMAWVVARLPDDKPPYRP